MHVLCLTQLHHILLLYDYWLLVSASMDHHQGNIYKKLKNAGAYYQPDDGPLRPKLAANSSITIKYYIVVSEYMHSLFY